MMPYSYKPPKPPTWSPYRKYSNSYKPKSQLKKYDDTVMEPVKEPVSKPIPRDNLVPPLFYMNLHMKDILLRLISLQD